MLPKSPISLTLQGWYYLIVLAFVFGGALLRDINLLFVIVGIMVGPLALNGVLTVLTLRRLRFERTLPEGISAGDLLIAEIGVSNPRRRLGSWAVLVEDRIRKIDSRDNLNVTARALFPYVAAGGTDRVAYRCRLAQRGRYRFGPLRVITRFPFGLTSRKTVVDVRETITVVPRLGKLSPQWCRSDNSTRQVGSQRSRHRQGLMEGEYHGLRDWRSGDSRSWIHWRTTAKRDQLTVRQFERHENQDLSLLLDLWHDDPASSLALERVELAVSFVATIVAEQCRRGSSRLQVGTAGREVRLVKGFASMVTLREVMELLATAESDHADRLPELLDRTLVESQTDNRIVIVSTRPTDLSDTNRFLTVWDDLTKRNVLGRITCFDVSSDDIGNQFQLS
jgi:uncharacterized protein (DUF58 family)